MLLQSQTLHGTCRPSKLIHHNGKSLRYDCWSQQCAWFSVTWRLRREPEHKRLTIIKLLQNHILVAKCSGIPEDFERPKGESSVSMNPWVLRMYHDVAYILILNEYIWHLEKFFSHCLARSAHAIFLFLNGLPG